MQYSILITGGAGFIGSHLVDELVRQGHKITVIDNLSLGKISNLNFAIKSGLVSFLNFDINNKEMLFDVFDKNSFDFVFHFAANSDIENGAKNSNIDLNNTFLTTYNVLRAMAKYNVKKIFFASTSAIYGVTDSSVDENYGPLFPISHYGASKLASEAFISSFAESAGIQAWIARFPNVVGERATHGVIFDFIKKLIKNPNELEVLGDGEQTKPYLYVKDLIDAILHIMQNSNNSVNYYNIGVSTTTKVKDIAQMVIEEMQLDASIKYTGGIKGWIGDVPKFSYDIQKIQKLGWQAKKSSNEAVRTAIKYILEKDFGWKINDYN